MNADPKYPSRDLTYEWGRTAPEQLSKEADALDTKIIAIFATSCLILGVISALVGKIRCNISLLPFAIAVFSFAIILIKTLWVIRPQWLFVADSPRILKEDYWKLEPDEAKEKYWEFVEKDFDTNHEIVKHKGQALLWLVPLLALETVSLLIWLLL
jgi:hypothetical protein